MSVIIALSLAMHIFRRQSVGMIGLLLALALFQDPPAQEARWLEDAAADAAAAADTAADEAWVPREKMRTADQRDAEELATAELLASVSADPCEVLTRVQVDLNRLEEGLAVHDLMLDVLSDAESPADLHQTRVARLSALITAAQGKMLYAATAICDRR